MSLFKQSEPSDSQIDPFNAGEPVMPWDDPSALHDDCAFEEGSPYDAPSTNRDTGRGANRRIWGAPQEKETPRSTPNPREKRRHGCAKVFLVLVLISLLLNLVGCIADALGGALGPLFDDEASYVVDDDDSEDYDDYDEDEAGAVALVEARLAVCDTQTETSSLEGSFDMY